MGQKNSLSQLFPSDSRLISSTWGTPAHSAANKFTPSLASAAKQYTFKVWSNSVTTWQVTYSEFEWLAIWFFFNLILFVSHLSLVYKQLFSGQKATHKLFTKNKAKQGGHIFCCLFDFFLHGQCWQTKCSRQAGRWAGGQPPSPALPCQLEGGCRAVTLLRVIWEPGHVSPSDSMPALPANSASGCVWVLTRQPEMFLFRFIRFITFMTMKIYSRSTPGPKGPGCPGPMNHKEHFSSKRTLSVFCNVRNQSRHYQVLKNNVESSPLKFFWIIFKKNSKPAPHAQLILMTSPRQWARLGPNRGTATPF